MPSLQLDVAAAPDRETQRDLAARLTAIYAEVMDAPPEIVTVVILLTATSERLDS